MRKSISLFIILALSCLAYAKDFTVKGLKLNQSKAEVLQILEKNGYTLGYDWGYKQDYYKDDDKLAGLPISFISVSFYKDNLSNITIWFKSEKMVRSEKDKLQEVTRMFCKKYNFFSWFDGKRINLKGDTVSLEGSTLWFRSGKVNRQTRKIIKQKEKAYKKQLAEEI